MDAMSLDPITRKLLLDWFVDLDTPEGLRAELIEGEFVMTLVPDGRHEHCISRTARQVYRQSPADMEFSANKGLLLQSADGCPQDHVIPDGTFASKALQLYRGADRWMPCEGVALVLEVTSEVTSFKPQTDRETKRRCYARGGIPLYLLVDREASWTTLFSDPASGDYREVRAAAFGKPLTLPDPFAFDLDTSDFL
ncbi:Uma2 family endonuclease [Streptomyces sp. NBC_01373]|uniref:Uma2 family endonuclease n=1 Tax=Streptomyces sp. NBC_01373 TaxID=2903843 RepID=UPI002253EBE5|nr:Uma2 family endonuclease [Streptomyces sp. NBC_01373]MCX4701213.1 Uma2 family endonuclease [Streptomyces sp. NBC_01373]